MDLRSLRLQDLDAEGLAAVLLWILRRNLKQGCAGYVPFSWVAIVAFELAPLWLGKDVERGIWRRGSVASMYAGNNVPALRQRALDAVELLRAKGLVTRHPEQSNDEFIVPTGEGWAIHIEIEDDPPWLALVRDARWILEKYRSGIPHLTGRTKEGDEHGATAFWAKSQFFVTCAHNLELSDWALHHADLRMTAEDLEARRHPKVDLAILVPRTSVITTLDMAALRFWDDKVEDGETAFILGYPKVYQRQPSLTPMTKIVSKTIDYAATTAFLSFEGALPGGYSGGPMLNDRGCVIGVATEETFGQPGERGEPAVVFGHATPIGYLDEIDAH